MGFVWPVNCHFVCVIVRTNIEMPTLIPGFLRAAAPEQIPDLSLAFIESLHAASKVSQEIDSTPHCVTKAAQRQRSTSENAKASNEVPVYRAVSSPVLSKQTVLSQLVLQPQQTPSTNSVVNPTQLPHTVGFVSSDTSIGSIIAQAGVDSSDSVQLSRTPGSNDLLQTAPMLSGSIVEIDSFNHAFAKDLEVHLKCWCDAGFEQISQFHSECCTECRPQWSAESAPESHSERNLEHSPEHLFVRSGSKHSSE